MNTQRAELFYKSDLILGEGAIWHPQRKQFLYVDIEGKKLGSIDPVTKFCEEIQLDRRIGTLVPAANGNLVVALQGSIEELHSGSGELRKLSDIEKNLAENRCNDGKCDASGRFWVGTMHLESKPNAGALYCYQGKLQKKIGGVSISNGICWSPDNSIMYYIDSAEYNIKAYDFDLPSGNISNERIIAEIKEPGCMPDGMTIDEEGNLWVAIWGGCCVHQYNARTRELMGKITVDAPNVTSCSFGGADYRQLFITTARTGLNKKELEQYPLSGSLFMVHTRVRGVPPNYFKEIM
ncbi:MAG TPA: SMP-30/gluconolactonase/LRE family protein [Puia sp.]|nr:SMP-30/gluconolactonase/LRE family protein [Puia sp.]